jgi:glycosyltransferase domain-containing protein
MMSDLTLLVSTHDALLAPLLSYFEAEKADCHILVLDSSCPEAMMTNRRRVAESSLDVEYMEFVTVTADEKIRQGGLRVKTPFCALCTDADVIMLPGLRRCLDALRRDPAACFTHGWSFKFIPLPNGDMNLSDFVRPTSVEEETSLRRLARSFEQLQIPSCSPFRTPALQKLCEAFQPSMNGLFRDLAWAALRAIQGKILTVPNFSHGRRRAPSGFMSHPLRWLCSDPGGLLLEYLRYRELLIAALMRRPDNELRIDELPSLLDMIHLRYLLKHSPDAVLAFIAGQEIAGVNAAEYSADNDVDFSDRNAAHLRVSSETRSMEPVTLRGGERSYVLFPSFYAPMEIDCPPLDEIVRLIGALDIYRPPIERALAREGEA